VASTVAGRAKIKIPDSLAHRRGDRLAAAAPCVSPVLAKPSASSSKYYPGIPCVTARRSIAGYHRNRECQAVSQRKRELRTRRAVSRKQSRRAAYQNHVVRRTIANYAKNHGVALRVEDLAGVSSRNITRLAQRSDRAFPQFLSFPRYRCALLGLALLEVCAAHDTKQCSPCARICDRSRTHRGCPTSGHNDHRDANAAFHIAARPWTLGCVPNGGRGDRSSAPSPGLTDGALEDAHAIL
jgi:transposase